MLDDKDSWKHQEGEDPSINFAFYSWCWHNLDPDCPRAFSRTGVELFAPDWVWGAFPEC